MWPFKTKKPEVVIYNCFPVEYDPSEVTVIDNRVAPIERSTEYDKAYKKGMGALDRLCIGEGCDKQSCGTPPPDTIESLINRLIELGEPKPEVVITGEKRVDGRESYTATVDGKFLEWLRDDIWISQSVTRDFETIEKAVISALEARIARVVTETTTITY